MKRINFSEIKRDIVYIFYAEKENDKIPFYIGESGRGIGRFGDYISAKFSASTDFKIGNVSRLIENNGYTIIIEYDYSNDRKKREKELIQEYKSKFDNKLINGKFGYNYKIDDEKDILKKMKEFVNQNFK